MIFFGLDNCHLIFLGTEMFFDPLYLILLTPALLLSGWAAMRTKSTFAKYANRGTASHLTGAQIAEAILRDNSIHDVRVEPTPGHLSDHYDPRGKVLRLSPQVYNGRSMSSFGVAAHEVGHAIQDAKGYAPLRLRSQIVPIVSFAAPISMLVIFASLMLGGAATVLGANLAWVGLGLFGTNALFSLVTLPVEYDASRRALKALQQGGYVSPEELRGAKKVLNAAALTYVAAAVIAVVTMLYWALKLGLLGGRRED